MRIALIHKHHDEQHLESVKTQMQRLGPPTIEAVWMECYGHWVALEGCHRLRAAHVLGLVPEIEEVEYSDDDYDADGQTYVISEICDDSHDAVVLEFD